MEESGEQLRKLNMPAGSRRCQTTCKAAPQAMRSKPSSIWTWEPLPRSSRHEAMGETDAKNRSTGTMRAKEQLDLNNPNQRRHSTPTTAGSRNGCAASMASPPKTCPITSVGAERSRRCQTHLDRTHGSWATLASDRINSVRHKSVVFCSTQRSRHATLTCPP